MIKNNIKIALRTFGKYKLTSFINILGLALGIACVSLAYVFIKHELSFDKFHKDHEHIFWLNATINNSFNLSTISGPFAPTLMETSPEVVDYCRLEVSQFLVFSSTEAFNEKVLFVDEQFFDFFDYKLISGNVEMALKDPNSVILSEELATKYFGTANPIGKEFEVIHNGQKLILNITGVVENVPVNSSIQYELLAPIALKHRDNITALGSDWNQFPVTGLVKVRNPKDTAKVVSAIQTIKEEHYNKDGFNVAFNLYSLDDYHLNNGMYLNGFNSPAEKNYLYIFGAIGLLILLVACFNFANLANALGSQRVKEIGVRKVLGAHKKQLMSQFLTESVMISVFSMLAALIFVQFALVYASQMFDYQLSFNWHSPEVLFSIIGITLFTGMLAGAYPAILLSRLQTIDTFKKEYKIGSNNWVTKGSLIFQFTLSIGLLACTFIMYQQQVYIKNTNLGFDEEAVVVIPTQAYLDQGPEEEGTGIVPGESIVNQFREAALQIPEVVGVTGVSNSFGKDKGNRANFVEDEEGNMNLIFDYRIEPNYIDLLDIEVLEGRNFLADNSEQGDMQKVIVNEAFMELFEYETIEGLRLPPELGEYQDAEVIGLVKDFHFQSLKSEIAPMILQTSRFGYQDILIKIKPQNVQATLNQLQKTWKGVRPDRPFYFTFLEEDIQNEYEMESRWGILISLASILAVVIASLGLLGLVALSLVQRTKEIGIRKVLGATITNIISLITKDFLKLTLIALLVAAPLAWYAMNKWLEIFAYRIEVNWWIFPLAGSVAALIASLTIGIQSVKAALANPV
ncbi:MAG: FtsX-like permease family protein, partial [Bacteroidota bacterium]